MIDLYTDTTPNGYKISIMLEEVGLPYKSHHVDIGEGDQFKPEFLKLSPNNKIPAIVDSDGPGGKPYGMMESGAILMYLAEKTGKLWPKETARPLRRRPMAVLPDGPYRPHARPGPSLPHVRARADPLRRRPLHQGGQAPLRRPGQAAQGPRLSSPATTRSPTSPPGRGCAARSGRASSAPTIRTCKRWFDAIAARPAVERGLSVFADKVRNAPMDAKAKEILFGAAQYQQR